LKRSPLSSTRKFFFYLSGAAFFFLNLPHFFCLYSAGQLASKINKSLEKPTLDNFKAALKNYTKEIEAIRESVESFATGFQMPGFDVSNLKK
jgi:hypothetical protein